MKFFSLWILSLLYLEINCYKKMCTLDILRSFGYHSLITPNRSNLLCPKLSFNCCTNHDQMRMHKSANHPFTLLGIYRRNLRFRQGIRSIG